MFEVCILVIFLCRTNTKRKVFWPIFEDPQEPGELGQILFSLTSNLAG